MAAAHSYIVNLALLHCGYRSTTGSLGLETPPRAERRLSAAWSRVAHFPFLVNTDHYPGSQLPVNFGMIFAMQLYFLQLLKLKSVPQQLNIVQWLAFETLLLWRELMSSSCY